MADCVAPESCTGKNFTRPILRSECIGNSLITINKNFEELDRAVCTVWDESLRLNPVDSSTIAFQYNPTTRELIANTTFTPITSIPPSTQTIILTGGISNNTPIVAKAWVSFNGAGTVGANQTIRSHYNVSSVTKTGTGQYTINFSNPMSDTNYVIAGTAQYRNDGTTGRGSFVGPYSSSTDPYSLNSVKIQATRVDSKDGQYTDSPIINVVVFGN